MENWKIPADVLLAACAAVHGDTAMLEELVAGDDDERPYLRAAARFSIEERKRREAERLEAERLGAERLGAGRIGIAAERLEAERLEAGRLEAEWLEAERLAAEWLKASNRAAAEAILVAAGEDPILLDEVYDNSPSTLMLRLCIEGRIARICANEASAAGYEAAAKAHRVRARALEERSVRLAALIAQNKKVHEP